MLLSSAHVGGQLHPLLQRLPGSPCVAQRGGQQQRTGTGVAAAGTAGVVDALTAIVASATGIVCAIAADAAAAAEGIRTLLDRKSAY